MQHIFTITEDKRELINRLFLFKSDDEFVLLRKEGVWCDIAQWSSKYQNVKILTLPEDKLNMQYCINR